MTPALQAGASQRLALATMMLMVNHATSMHRLHERATARRNDAGPIVVVFVVAIAVLLAIAVALTVAAIVFCAQKNMDFEWLIQTSWFTVKVACSS